MPVNARFAGPDDIEAMVGMGLDMVAESPRYRRFNTSAVKLRAVVQQAVSGQNGCAIVVEKGGALIGMVVAFTFEHFIAFDRIVTDAAVYVAPDHRGGSAFARMMRLFEQWARDQAADEIALGISTEVAPERTVHVYERLGYSLAPQYTMTKDLRDV